MVTRWFRRWTHQTPIPDYGRIAPWLFVGPALDNVGYTHIAERGVTHVLDLRSEASDDPAVMEALNLAWRRVPIDDQAAPTSDQLAEIEAWLDASASSSRPVLYVHCQGGMGRSPTVAMALLMRRGFTRAEAHRLVVGARSVSVPSTSQGSWLAGIEREIQAHSKTGDDSEVVGGDDR